MSTLFMTLGLPGSGKSTWAKEYVNGHAPGSVVRINKDDLRAMMFDAKRGKGTEAQVLAARDAMVVTALRAGLDVIVDDTNIRVVHEKKLRELAASYGAAFVVQDFTDVSVTTCLTRDAGRSGRAHVGAAVIETMARQLRERPTVNEWVAATVYVAPQDAPTCVLVDIDGTLAHMHNRGPYEESKVGDDHPDAAVVQLVQDLLAAGERVIVMSGRTDGCRQDTQAWLDRHVAPGLPLLMRAQKDGRPDSVVKRELFEKHIAGRFAVRFVLDDRAQVVRM